jgi:hypothetical protein
LKRSIIYRTDYRLLITNHGFRLINTLLQRGGTDGETTSTVSTVYHRIRPHRFLCSFLPDDANAVAGKVGAVLFAGRVAGVEGEGKDVETECCAKSVRPLRAATTAGRAIIAGGFSVADAVT